MNIETEVVNRTTAILKLSGRLDTANAPVLEQKIRQWGGEIGTLILDFSDVKYISSMGLRVLLYAQKSSVEKKREFIVRNIGDEVREVFEMTGFIDLIVKEEGFAVVRGEEGRDIVLHLNGGLTTENVTAVWEELSKIRRELGTGNRRATVVLDLRKLYCIMPKAPKSLLQAIQNTAWPGRKLMVRNVPSDYAKELAAAGLVESDREQAG
ncbi:MAG: STAS domain-containing protein [Treponema sp.]|nr:STAS domain-containing protein [Treponema sp.]